MLSKALQSAAGNAGGEPLFVDSVFSTYLYTGNGSTQTITNNIDLSGEGGMVWLKKRNSATNSNHQLADTSRGVNNTLISNLTDPQYTSSTYLTAFNSDGFSIGSNGNFNQNGDTFASWTFRKAQKFFDVVTYTGNGATGRNISHALGSVPGFVVVKLTSTTGNWNCIHRQNGSSWTALQLNSTAAGGSPSASVWGDGVSFIAPTSANFTVGSVANNTNGATYVAYLFAHDAGGFGDDGSDNVISCGSFTTDGSGNATVSLGYEPQYVMYKRSDGTGSWLMFDNMRGMTVNTTNGDAILFANLSDAESTVDWIQPTATGFNPYNIAWNATYIYIAIRRGPMKTPESGTEVFSPVAYSGTGTNSRAIASSITPDSVFFTYRDTTSSKSWYTRLQGNGNGLASNSTNAEFGVSTLYGPQFNSLQTGYVQGTNDSILGGMNASGYTFINYLFKRAPGFFDVVCYTGTGVARTVAHNLTVAPEMMIVKRRNGAAHWPVYAQAAGTTKNGYLSLGSAFAVTGANPFNGTAPTSSVFTVGSDSEINGSGGTYVAYLFATCPGVSKVGSYTGTGTTLQVNCGFTGGARFVLIKRTDSTGDWYVWDSARGIVAGNDPYLLLNSTAAEVTSTDYIDTYSAGFEISSTAPAAINANGGSFIYLAIA